MKYRNAKTVWEIQLRSESAKEKMMMNVKLIPNVQVNKIYKIGSKGKKLPSELLIILSISNMVKSTIKSKTKFGYHPFQCKKVNTVITATDIEKIQ